MRHFILLLCLLCAPFAAQSKDAKQGAQMQIDSVAYNFGEISRKGGDAEHTFTIRNTGNSPLVITQAETTCTCIKVKYPKRPIAPHSKASVEVKYEVSRKELGAFHKIIKLHSNSADGACQILTIHGTSVEK